MCDGAGTADCAALAGWDDSDAQQLPFTPEAQETRSIEEGQARHIEVLESGYAMRLLVYEVRDGKEQLVGFNMVSVLGTREANDEFDVEAGRYRRDIINTFG